MKPIAIERILYTTSIVKNLAKCFESSEIFDFTNSNEAHARATTERYI